MNTIAKSFKIRCSAIGQICGGFRGNAARGEYKLPQTAKTYCKQWLKEQIYDRRKEVSSKSMEWGSKVEFDAIEYLAKHTGLGWVDKNTERKENDFLTGTCDLWLPEQKHIIDTKCSVDCFTFPLFDKTLPDVEYADQVQGYMELWGAETGAVSYVLMSAPQDWILKQARFGLPYGYTEADYLEFAKKYNYDHFPPDLRIKTFEFEKNPDRLEFISKRVDACRLYIQDLIDGMN